MTSKTSQEKQNKKIYLDKLKKICVAVNSTFNYLNLNASIYLKSKTGMWLEFRDRKNLDSCFSKYESYFNFRYFGNIYPPGLSPCDIKLIDEMVTLHKVYRMLLFIERITVWRIGGFV